MNLKYHIKQIFVTLLVLVFYISAFSQNPTDSLLKVAESLPDDTSKVIAYNNFVWKVKTTNVKLAIKIGKRSLVLAKKINYLKGESYAAKNLGAVFFYAGEYDKALTYYELSLKKSEKAGFKKGIAIAFRNIGNVYYQQSIYQKALEYYFKSLPIREEIHDTKGVGAVYGAIGLVYSRQGKKGIPSALEYYEKALKISDEINDVGGMISNYLYLGALYFDKSQKLNSSPAEYKLTIDKAIKFSEKCKELSTEYEEWRFVASSEEILGQIYLELNENQKAINTLRNSLAIRKKENNLFGQIKSYTLIGQYYLAENDLQNAKVNLKKAYKIATDLNSPDSKTDAVQKLMIVESALKNYKTAYKYSIEFSQLKDSISNKENTKKQAELALQYEFDKKEKLREAEEAKAKLKREEEKRRQAIVNYALIGGFFSMLVIALVIFRSYRNKQKANKLLEDLNEKILSKNSLLNQKNEKIEAQKDEISAQRDVAFRQRDKIAEQNKHITDSIIYAQRIQRAVMPPPEYMESVLDEHFILLKPRDIVSGDYYWSTQKNGKLILAAADCTGHGVPGAFMSLLGISFLNQIVNKIDTSKGEKIEAAQILNELRSAVKISLGQTGKEGEAKDGMDMALVVIDIEKKELQYAGAHNPLLLVRNGELIQYKADKMPVGIFYHEKESFTNNLIQMKKGDIAYLYSDGYIDQFGGPQGRKYMSGRFKKFILKHYQKPLHEQRKIFDNNLKEWISQTNERGETFEQTDDVLVIGLKI